MSLNLKSNSPYFMRSQENPDSHKPIMDNANLTPSGEEDEPEELLRLAVE